VGGVAGAVGEVAAYKRRMEWAFPWASSFQSDFNYDYGVGFTEEQQRSGVVEHDYHAMNTRRELRDEDICAVYGTDAATMTREAPGMSAFALEDGVVHHTYSAYVRGLDGLWGHVPVARPRAERRERDNGVRHG
jgi:predicted dithiol-disulfide oxidoreductase (DUF899 family)